MASSLSHEFTVKPRRLTAEQAAACWLLVQGDETVTVPTGWLPVYDLQEVAAHPPSAVEASESVTNAESSEGPARTPPPLPPPPPPPPPPRPKSAVLNVSGAAATLSPKTSVQSQGLEKASPPPSATRAASASVNSGAAVAQNLVVSERSDANNPAGQGGASAGDGKRSHNGLGGGSNASTPSLVVSLSSLQQESFPVGAGEPLAVRGSGGAATAPSPTLDSSSGAGVQVNGAAAASAGQVSSGASSPSLPPAQSTAEAAAVLAGAGGAASAPHHGKSVDNAIDLMSSTDVESDDDMDLDDSGPPSAEAMANTTSGHFELEGGATLAAKSEPTAALPVNATMASAQANEATANQGTSTLAATDGQPPAAAAAGGAPIAGSVSSAPTPATSGATAAEETKSGEPSFAAAAEPAAPAAGTKAGMKPTEAAAAAATAQAGENVRKSKPAGDAEPSARKGRLDGDGKAAAAAAAKVAPGAPATESGTAAGVKRVGKQASKGLQKRGKERLGAFAQKFLKERNFVSEVACAPEIIPANDDYLVAFRDSYRVSEQAEDTATPSEAKAAAADGEQSSDAVSEQEVSEEGAAAVAAAAAAVAAAAAAAEAAAAAAAAKAAEKELSSGRKRGLADMRTEEQDAEAVPRKDNGQANSTPLRARTLELWNLPYSTSALTLRNIFQRFGVIESLTMHVEQNTNRPAGHATVVFALPAAANAAYEANQELVLESREIRVAGPPSVASKRYYIAPSAAKKQKTKQVRCAVCGGAGHEASDRSHIVCSNCGRGGHTMAVCPRPRVSDADRLLCLSCEELGHVESQCPTGGKRSTPRRVKCVCGRVSETGVPCCLPPKVAPEQTVFCSNCGGNGHEQPQCGELNFDQMLEVHAPTDRSNGKRKSGGQPMDFGTPTQAQHRDAAAAYAPPAGPYGTPNPEQERQRQQQWQDGYVGGGNDGYSSQPMPPLPPPPPPPPPLPPPPQQLQQQAAPPPLPSHNMQAAPPPPPPQQQQQLNEWGPDYARSQHPLGQQEPQQYVHHSPPPPPPPEQRYSPPQQRFEGPPPNFYQQPPPPQQQQQQQQQQQHYHYQQAASPPRQPQQQHQQYLDYNAAAPAGYAAAPAGYAALLPPESRGSPPQQQHPHDYRGFGGQQQHLIGASGSYATHEGNGRGRPAGGYASLALDGPPPLSPAAGYAALALDGPPPLPPAVGYASLLSPPQHQSAMPLEDWRARGQDQRGGRQQMPQEGYRVY